MNRSDSTQARTLWLLVLAGSPFLVALLLVWLAASGRTDVATAAALLLAMAAFAVALAWYARRDALRIADYLDRLERGALRRERAPRAGTEPGRLLVGQLARLSRLWARRHARVRRQLAIAQTVIEAIPDPLLLVDGHRRVVRANAAAHGQFGAHLLDRDLVEVLRDPPVIAAVDEVIAGGPGRMVEVEWIVPVPQHTQVRVTPFARTEPDPAVMGDEMPMEEPREMEPAGPAVLVLFHDVTAIRRAEQMRADFVANASHELRTPLASLVGFIETLQGPARDDPKAQERFLEIMQRQADRMSRLIADLLSLSRIELDEHTLPAGQVEIPALLRAVVAGLELRAEQRGMTVRLEVVEPLPKVQGDADQLTQVFQNLLDNALSYGREGTEVTVTVTPQGPTDTPTGLSVAVRDRGEGIPREHIPRLTERFYRADPARSKAAGGTGLGLAIVKHIVSRHRGRLLIDSTLGEGSTFTVQFPAALPAIAKPAPTVRKLS